MNQLFIGFTGRKLSGKTTCAEFFHQFIPAKYTVKIIGFADELKQELANLTGGSVAIIEQNKQVIRPLLQFWGTEIRRQQNENYWIEKLKEQVKDINVILIPDIRFQNEYEYVKQHKGYVLKVERKQPKGQADNHSSETQWIPYDWTICNDGTLLKLQKECNYVWNYIRERHGEI